MFSHNFVENDDNAVLHKIICLYIHLIFPGSIALKRRVWHISNQIRIFNVARIAGVITKSTKAKSICG